MRIMCSNFLLTTSVCTNSHEVRSQISNSEVEFVTHALGEATKSGPQKLLSYLAPLIANAKIMHIYALNRNIAP